MEHIRTPTQTLDGQRGACHLALAAWLLALFHMGSSVSQAQPAAREYDVKATLLFNFSQFVQWPASSMSDTNAPFVIGILGKDPFGAFLEGLVKNERAHGKPIVVRHYRKVEHAFEANILFIGNSDRERLAGILTALGHRPVLTVGDEEIGGEGFARHGGMIALATENGTIRIRVNLGQARAAGLAISAKLLRLCQIVEPEK